MQQEMLREQKVAEQRELLFRKGRPPLQLTDKVVILVDDGLATGATMKAAIQSVKEQHAKKVVVAVPVAPPDTLAEIEMLVDQVFCLYAPVFFQAVGQFYELFNQTSDQEVMEALSLRKT
jgi:putative phosphoribosyl transferase